MRGQEKLTMEFEADNAIHGRSAQVTVCILDSVLNIPVW